MDTMSGIGYQSYCPIDKFRQMMGTIVDVRSPKEFSKGHWPGSINLPLFTDEQREAVGKIYKNAGREQAILTGLKFTTDRISELKKSLEDLKDNQNEIQYKSITKNCIRIYCWRGGMRSASVAWLTHVLGLNPLILTGGYKTYRKWALQQFEKKWEIQLIGGKTGTGKTNLLHELDKKGFPTVDLEGLASHRGSSFGGLGHQEQPSTEHYENLIAESLEKCKMFPQQKIWLESESGNLGKCRIPVELLKQMSQAPVFELERPKAERVEELVRIYAVYPKDQLEAATLRISRRLGPQRTKEAINAIKSGKFSKACEAMLDYYDRCYKHELDKASSRKTIDIGGLSDDSAVIKLIRSNIVG